MSESLCLSEKMLQFNEIKTNQLFCKILVMEFTLVNFVSIINDETLKI